MNYPPELLVALKHTCLLCLASPCKVGRERQLVSSGGTDSITFVECKSCAKKYKRAEKLSHIKDSPERRDWFRYFTLIDANLQTLAKQHINSESQ
jgi:hypothetical protein